MELSGGGYGVRLRYVVQGKPLLKGQNHCRPNQRLSGGAPTTCVMMAAMVNGAQGFNEPYPVADGASELFIEVFFDPSAAYARSAMVAGDLPFDTAVEIDVVAETHAEALHREPSAGARATAAEPQGRSQ